MLVSKVFAQKKGGKSYDSYKYVLNFGGFRCSPPLIIYIKEVLFMYMKEVLFIYIKEVLFIYIKEVLFIYIKEVLFIYIKEVLFIYIKGGSIYVH